MFVALFDPFGLLLVRVGRIAEHRLSSPILGKSVVSFRVEFSAFRRFRSSAGIKRKGSLASKLRIAACLSSSIINHEISVFVKACMDSFSFGFNVVALIWFKQLVYAMPNSPVMPNREEIHRCEPIGT